jgi:hypothetical protein
VATGDVGFTIAQTNQRLAAAFFTSHQGDSIGTETGF